jgi:hypothetical protein
MNDFEKQQKRIAELDKKLDALEKRYNKLLGRADEYIPRTTATMREGLPLEIFSRMAPIERDFRVLGLYAYSYFSKSESVVERSIDIYAVRDSTYTVPEGHSKMSGKSWPERDHLLIEVKQRRPGVEWIFAQKPTSQGYTSVAGSNVPVANSGFEIRPNESGLSSNPNPKDVNNAIYQLNQAYMPFRVDLSAKRSFEAPGTSWQYASSNGRDQIYLILITNAKLRYFSPPPKFSDIGDHKSEDENLFPEVPWIIFQPEHSVGLQFHQKEVLRRAHAAGEIGTAGAGGNKDPDLLEYLAKFAYEIHIINFDHLDKVVELVKKPPRIEKIEFSLKVDDKAPIKFSIE